MFRQSRILISLNEVAELQIRTISAILAWVVVALLIVNFSFKSDLLLWISLAIVAVAVVIYFVPRFRKSAVPTEDKSFPQKPRS